MNSTGHRYANGDPGASSGSQTPVVVLKGIVKRFGAFTALRNVDFDLLSGEVHVLLGENGAGKSTLIQVIAGALAPEEGEYWLCGERLSGATPATVRKAGVSAVFQEFSLVSELTIAENIFLGIEKTRFGRLAKGDMNAAAAEMLRRLEFHLDPTTKIAGLRRSQKQMVEIAKALIHNAKVLIFDEPTASLADQEATALFNLIAALKRSGIAIVYITHRMAEIERLADRVTVLRDGQVITTVSRSKMSEALLVEAMTGRTFEALYPQIERRPGEIVLKLSKMTLASGLARDIDLDVRRGEVLGIAGLAGCGKSEVIRAVFGLERVALGEVILDGRRVTNTSPGKMLSQGVCYFPSDRAREGLALGQSLRINASMAALDVSLFSHGAFLLRPAAERDFARRAIERLRIRTRGTGVRVEQLSGGNKQKVMLARGMSRNLHLYMFDEPTVGIDVQAKFEVYSFIKELTESGNAVVIVSSEMAEVIHLSHRVCVMHEGRQVRQLEGSDITEEALLSCIFHQHNATLVSIEGVPA